MMAMVRTKDACVALIDGVKYPVHTCRINKFRNKDTSVELTLISEDVFPVDGDFKLRTPRDNMVIIPISYYSETKSGKVITKIEGTVSMGAISGASFDFPEDFGILESVEPEKKGKPKLCYNCWEHWYPETCEVCKCKMTK